MKGQKLRLNVSFASLKTLAMALHPAVTSDDLLTVGNIEWKK